MYGWMTNRVNKYAERRINKEVWMEQTDKRLGVTRDDEAISKRAVDVAATAETSNKFSKNKQYRFN